MYLGDILKVLFYDIETSIMELYGFSLWNQNFSPEQIKKDWHILSCSASWLHEKKIMYKDQRHRRPMENDKALVKWIRKLICEADIVVTQNGIDFDNKKVLARMAKWGIKPFRSFKNSDTKIMAGKLGLTSRKLEYMAKFFDVSRKIKSKKYPGVQLWIECQKRNMDAWKEMEKYNKQDVRSLKDVYKRLLPYSQPVNLNQFSNGKNVCSSCGESRFKKNGFALTETGSRFQRYECKNCGAEARDGINHNKNTKKMFRPIK